MSVTTPTARPAQAGPPTRRYGRGFWIVAYTFLVAMAFSTVPAPLYVLYQQRDGFSAFAVTVVFTAYAIGVATSLFLVGHVSDSWGRRPVLALALVIEAASAVVFLYSSGETALIAARFVSGVAVGMLTATATAHLAELHATARPGAGPGRSDVVSTAANIGGLGVGAMVSGLLAQFVPVPLRVPYLVFLALLALALLGLAAVPETVRVPEHRPRYRPQRISVETSQRARYALVTLAGFVAFAVFGLFTSLAPGFVAGTLHHPSRALAGGVVLLVFGSAAATQTFLARAGAPGQLSAGFTAVTVGLIPLTVAVWNRDLALFLIGGAVTGGGAGALFRGAVSTVAAVARPGARGEALAGLFLVSYLGLTVPVLGLGIATQHLPTRDALVGFATFLLVVVAVTAAGVRRLRPQAGRA